MSAEKFIYDWLNKMVTEYNWLHYKYEFKEGIHYIAAFPQSIIEFDEEYCQKENDFYDSFLENYPNERIYIGIEERFFTCSTNAKIIKSILENSYKTIVNTKSVEKYDFFDQHCTDYFILSSDYPLAA